jgi:aspartyl-tRNA(Asn)/glutamyl-tRNA(Gln) amidotransferase subunit B
MFIQGAKNEWELVVGLEVHAQLKSDSKLFSSASTLFGEENNSQVSYVDAAMPGMLPVANAKCIELAVKAGLAINGKVNKFSMFDRKNYFYPDSPQGYQITQFFHPIINDGCIVVTNNKGDEKEIHINRIHIEQDTGKSIHDQSRTETFIDLNRVGMPLIEIVTNPDFSDPSEVESFMKKLRNILRYTEVCDGDLEKGSMRCDANVSMRKKGAEELGTRVEIKNLNSFKNITKAILTEANRQVNLLEEGGKVDQETRLYDVNLDQTRSMRRKEDAHDYRYFPDPDLLPINISSQFIENIRQTMQELPYQKKERYLKEFGITPYDTDVITAEKNVAAFFEDVANQVNPKLAANWICAELFGRLNKKGITFDNLPINVKNFVSLLKMIDSNHISGKIAKEVLDKMFENDQDPKTIIKRFNLSQVSDSAEIEKYVDQVITSNQEKVEQFRSGKDRLFGFFVGEVMKISKGKANPKSVNKILIEKLKP